MVCICESGRRGQWNPQSSVASVRFIEKVSEYTPRSLAAHAGQHKSLNRKGREGDAENAKTTKVAFL